MVKATYTEGIISAFDLIQLSGCKLNMRGLSGLLNEGILYTSKCRQLLVLPQRMILFTGLSWQGAQSFDNDFILPQRLGSLRSKGRNYVGLCLVMGTRPEVSRTGLKLSKRDKARLRKQCHNCPDTILDPFEQILLYFYSLSRFWRHYTFSREIILSVDNNQQK